MKGAQRQHRSIWIALAAIFAMLFTAALPAYAVGVEEVTICSSHGDRTVFVAAEQGEVSSAEACSHCSHCTLATAVILPELSVQAQVVFYPAAVAQHASATSIVKAARAPPRPPSQGPPLVRYA